MMPPSAPAGRKRGGRSWAVVQLLILQRSLSTTNLLQGDVAAAVDVAVVGDGGSAAAAAAHRELMAECSEPPRNLAVDTAIARIAARGAAGRVLVLATAPQWRTKKNGTLGPHAPRASRLRLMQFIVHHLHKVVRQVRRHPHRERPQVVKLEAELLGEVPQIDACGEKPSADGSLESTLNETLREGILFAGA